MQKENENAEEYEEFYEEMEEYEEMNEKANIEEQNEEDEEQSEFEDRVIVDELEEDIISQYYNQQNNFKRHLTEIVDVELGEFKSVDSELPNNVAIYSTSADNPKFSLIQPIRDQLDNQFTKKIRKLMDMDDGLFESTVLQQLLTRKTTIITSNSFQHRMQTRECVTAVIASYICQKFAFISQLHYQQQLVKQQLINEQQFLENEVSELDNLEIKSTQQQFNGYTRPQILVLLPTKHHGWRFISMLLAAFPMMIRKNIQNFKRFERDFAPESNLTQYEVGDQKLLADELPDAVQINEKKPKEFYQQFCGDLDDEFCIGLGINKRGPHAIRLYQTWEKCDIIVASPLGLTKQFDYNELSSLHTCYLEMDYLLDGQQQSLQKLLGNLFRLPHLIKDQNIQTIAEPYIWGLPQQACQFIVFQAQEHEVTNGLFSSDFVKAQKIEFSVYDQNNFGTDENEIEKEKEEKPQLILTNQNQLGMSRIKFFDQFKQINFQTINMEGFLNVYERATDVLPPNALKFDLAKYPKLDYAVNKLLAPGTIFYFQNSFLFLRFKFVMKKLRKDVAFLNEELAGKEIGQEFSRFRKGEVENMAVTESFMYQRRLKLVSEKLVFVGAPGYKGIFEEQCEGCKGQAVLLWDEEDQVRMQNIMSQEVYERVVKARVVIV